MIEIGQFGDNNSAGGAMSARLHVNAQVDAMIRQMLNG
jgi:hypothetical protein